MAISWHENITVLLCAKHCIRYQEIIYYIMYHIIINTMTWYNIIFQK